ncbi:TonB-dependent receptor plug domain-containing protein [Bradyrhizobium roseum]|uniref:TonB-dependent receptor plug domain-containing protein n=1 Tax=Bradyrhizobium roseum TaxID=3056648 RepID=UPI00261473A0|nr:TonB-dependent receptor plug domain-containing protein [Bradyrhizobium roseus]WKA28744.1 TonB-dependent receptor plug domain-containing protein [Bradyrhizobium roseus]
MWGDDELCGISLWGFDHRGCDVGVRCFCTGTKTGTPLNQTAQSISVVSAERVRDQGVSRVRETLCYVPGVFAEPGGGDSRNDYFKVRGQDPNVYLNGGQQPQ